MSHVVRSGRPRAFAVALAIVAVLGGMIGFASSSNAAEDLQAPVIGPVQPTPSVVDVTTGPATVTFDVTVTDDLSGVRSLGGRSVSPTGATRSIDIAFTRGSFGDLDTGWHGTVIVPQYTAGTWQIQLTAQDMVGNQRNLSTVATFTALGTTDSAPPTFGSGTVSPQTVDVSFAPASVTFEIDVADDLSGVAGIAGRSISPAGATSTFGVTRIIGSTGDRSTRWRGTVTVPKLGANGTWGIQLNATDIVGNQTPLATRLSFNVTGTSDTLAPVFGPLTVSPTAVSVGGRSATVSFEVDVTDDFSGVADVAGRSVSPAGPTMTFPVTRVQGAIGDRTTRWRGTITVPQFAATGVWNIELLATDVVGNQTPLLSRGTFTVFSDTVSPVVAAVLSPPPNAAGWWSSPVTVTWDVSDPEPSSGLQPPLPAPVVISEEGIRTVSSGDVCDLDGNCSSVSLVVRLDTTSPSIEAASLAIPPVRVGDPVVLSATTADNLSGVVAGEWFLGADPGVGAATAMSSVSPAILQAQLGAGLPVGVHVAGVRVIDAAGNWSETLTTYVVVYDASGSFVTGAGWIVPGGPSSDAGDTLPRIDGTRAAHFGFNVRYQSGASTAPSGTLHFRFQIGEFQLESTSFNWLVTTPNMAKFDGLATINGSTVPQRFRVDARVGSGGQPDRFAITVWNPGTDPDSSPPLYKASGDVTGIINISR
jgi:hypothetical protein